MTVFPRIFTGPGPASEKMDGFLAIAAGSSVVLVLSMWIRRAPDRASISLVPVEFSME
jgi:hypothetical protein